ncbi:MAG: IS3 family transposase, partial [Gammaproteobacteria bacterium]|nr:IS3 family transposase [Gammaproteobacteria bacterium]
MKYGFIKSHSSEFSVCMMSRVLDVSTSGYYNWKKRIPCHRTVKRQARDQLIHAAFEQSKQRSGSPNVWRDLVDAGHECNIKTVATSMQRQGLRAKAARKFKVTTQSTHNLPVAPNLLKQNFTANTINEKWVGDITYLWTNEGWLYLATIIDLYSRAVIGWSLSTRINATLVCDALTMALWRRNFPTQVIVHSDRGSQYCSKDYRQLLKDHELICSMNAKGCCYERAA